MATVDDKVVAMSFESSKFESGVNSTIHSLDKLKGALKFPEAGKGLDDINKSAQRVDLSHIANGVDTIKNRLSALRLTAVAVFASVATQALSAGGRVIKSFTFGPILDGLHEYEQQLNSVQTILANTKSAGTNLTQVNKALNQLNHYADKTIYNFSQMTKNIGTFTAAGVDLQTSVTSIKGIANLAALSGSNAEQASTAMYQLSQAISAGRVSLQDWNSVVNAGMGGTVFQRALAQTAVKMGTLSDSAVQLKGKMKNVTIEGQSFRQSLQAGPGKASWLTSKVLTNTLSQFSGDLSKAQLKAQGFNDAEIKAIQSQAKMALNAATQVKTLSQLLDTTKEAIGSGWAQTWQLVLGNFGQAKTLFTNTSNAINQFVSNSAQARNKILKDWQALGGRTDLIAGIKNVFVALKAVLDPIHDAFREIFPRETGKELADATKNFRNFTETLKPSPKTVENLKRTFAGFFAVLDIGKQIVGGIFHVIGQLLGAVTEGSSGFLDFTGNIGDFLVSLDQAIKKGGILKNFFNTLGTILAAPIHILGVLRTALVSLFGGLSASGASSALGGLASGLNPLKAIINSVADAWKGFLKSFGDSDSTVRKAIDGIATAFGSLGSAIADVISHTNFSVVFAAINTGLIAGILVLLKKFTTGGFFSSFGGGVLSNISESFNALTGSLKAMQANVQASTLQKIAIAIALITASVVALSFIDPKKLNNALSAMAVGFGELLGAMAILTKISGSAGFVKVPIIAGSMILLAGAIDLLVLAVVGLAQLSWDQLVKGLTGVGALLVGISAAAIPLSRNSAGLISAGVGITAIAIAMNILALAVRQFGSMSVGELAKGLISVGVALGAIALAARLFPPGMPVIGLGLIAVGAGLKIIASAVSDFGSMDWGTIGKGIAGIAGSLVVIAGAMQLMPPNMVLTAAGLIGVSFALQLIAKAVGTMGNMSISEIAKGLGTLAGSLVILAVGLTAMSGSIAGAAALGIAAAGLALLTPALESLGKQSWSQIIKGLVSLAGALAVLGVASVLLEPAAPAMLAMGAALLAIGGGLALAGAGIFLIGTGLSAIAIAGPEAIKILIEGLVQLSQALPKMVTGFVDGLAEMAVRLAEAAPKFLTAIEALLDVLLTAIIDDSPKLAQAFTALLQAVLQVLRDNFPTLVQTGIQMLLALLRGIGQNAGQIVTAVATIITNFLRGIAANLGRIISAGVSIVTSLLKGLASGVVKIGAAVGQIIVKFIGAIANNLSKVATAGVSIVTKLISAIASKTRALVTAGANLIVNFVTGIGNAGARVITAGTNTIIKLINSLSRNSVKLANAGAKAIIQFLNGVATAIRRYEPQMIEAGANIGEAIVQGMIDGVGRLAGKLASKVESLITGLPGKAKHLLGIGSPSKVFAEIGKNIMLGLAQGITNTTAPQAAIADLSVQISKHTKNAGKTAGADFLKAFGDTLSIRPDPDPIDQAFGDISDKLKGKLAETIRDVRSAQTQIAKLKVQRKTDKGSADAQDVKQIKALEAQVRAMKSLEAALKTGRAELLAHEHGLNNDKSALKSLTAQYKQALSDLDAANQALATAISTRDNAITQFSEQFATLPELSDSGSGQQQLISYQKALQNQVNAVSTYSATLDQLRALGLDDATLQKLIADGTADQAFASALLAGGATAVQGLNALDAQLKSVSDTLGQHAGHDLYDAGVQAAQGLVNGLTASTGALVAAINKLVDKIIKQIKKKLKMKSPSQVFMEIGQLSMVGLANGFEAATPGVASAATNVVTSALSAVQNALGDIDANPTITPVLDLTQFETDARRMNIIASRLPIGRVTAAQAAGVSSVQVPAVTTAEQLANSNTLNFQQNNYSPEALSEIDIYRQTKNGLSQIKSALNIP